MSPTLLESRVLDALDLPLPLNHKHNIRHIHQQWLEQVSERQVLHLDYLRSTHSVVYSFLHGLSAVGISHVYSIHL
jgi:hypothetical protein